jgi:hypothetical protein
VDFRDVKFALGDVLISDLGRLVPASDNTDVSMIACIQKDEYIFGFGVTNLINT